MDKLLMDVAVLAGEIMLSSGAETYRVEDTMSHILKTSNRSSIEALALMTGIVATMNDEEMEQPITVVKTVNNRSTNLNNIIKTNEISRSYCAGMITLEEAYEQLKHVKEKQYSRTTFNIATALVATGFAMMFGGTLADVLVATVAGCALAFCVMFGKVTKMNQIFIDIVSAAVLSVVGLFCKMYLVPDLNIDIVTISAIMPMVPGVAITNAIRDTLQGDYLSGCARILEAFLKAASIAIGVAIGIAGGGLL